MVYVGSTQRRGIKIDETSYRGMTSSCSLPGRTESYRPAVRHRDFTVHHDELPCCTETLSAEVATHDRPFLVYGDFLVEEELPLSWIDLCITAGIFIGGTMTMAQRAIGTRHRSATSNSGM